MTNGNGNSKSKSKSRKFGYPGSKATKEEGVEFLKDLLSDENVENAGTNAASALDILRSRPTLNPEVYDVKKEEPPKKQSSKSPIVNNYYGGNGGGYIDYHGIEEERQARIKKDLTEAEKNKTEKKLLEEQVTKNQMSDAKKKFEERKKSRWDKYNEEKQGIEKDLPKRKKNETDAEYNLRVFGTFSDKTTKSRAVSRAKKSAIRAANEGHEAGIIEAGGPNVAEDIIFDKFGRAIKPVKNAARYTKNKVLDTVQNPDNRKAVKDTIKGVGKAIQNTTENLNKDLMAYGQAKALMNGTGEYTEKIVKDKYGNVVGVERTFKQHGDKGKKENTFGLKPAVQHKENKPTPTARKGKLEVRKGTLGKQQNATWDNESKEGPVNNTVNKPGIGRHRRSDATLVKGDKGGIGTHRRPGVTLTKGNKGGIGRHVNSNVQLVQSELPTLEEFNEAEPNIFGEDDFKGFAKNSFAGFKEKEQFHPINKQRDRAHFESTVAPQGNMLGGKKEKPNVWKK